MYAIDPNITGTLVHLNVGPKKKARQNIEAIRLLKQLQFSGRDATDADREVLGKFLGWGGLKWIFEEENAEWADEYAELRELLNPKEYEAARRSILNAYYTDPLIVQAIWKAVEHLGFKSGTVLEPACGINFFHTYKPAHLETSWIGVELDPMSAAIAQYLTPDGIIHNKGFQDVELPDNSIDLVISNFPFGDYGVFDRRYSSYNFDIHNYFFAKSLDKVRPGGLLVAISSTGTLSSGGNAKKCREYMASQSNLIAALRLPNDAFKNVAGTSVTTDLLFIQKFGENVGPNLTQWVHIEETEHYSTRAEKYLGLNEYYISHPENLLGTLEDDRLWPGRLALAPDGRDIPNAIAQAIEKLTATYQPDNSFQDSYRVPTELQSVPVFAYVQVGDEVFRREQSCLVKMTEQVERIKAWMAFRDQLNWVFEIQQNDCTDDELKTAQAELSNLYKKFTNRYGYLNAPINLKVFGDDPDSYRCRAAERWNERVKRGSQSEVFSKRTIRPNNPAKSAETAQDALLICLKQKGKVDAAYIQELLSVVHDPIGELSAAGLIYWEPLMAEDPETGEKYQAGLWVSADEYLSGNVRQKLEAARAANLPLNIAALEAIIPPYLLPPASPEIKAEVATRLGEKCDSSGEISVKLGSPWIEIGYIQEFAAKLLNCFKSNIIVEHSEVLGQWMVKGKGGVNKSAENITEWGTSRRSAIDLIECGLNLKDPVVYDKVEERSVVNQAATEAARQKLTIIKEQFNKWLWTDIDRAESLTRKYNETYNSTVLRKYDGRHLDLPGSNSAIQLREHQLNGVWRAVQSPSTLLAYEVGTGKTFTFCAIAMELRRLKLANKPMLVVLNSTIAQIEAEFRQLYPNAKLLVPIKDDFEKHNRRRFIAKIACGDWDAVIVTHTQFFAMQMGDDSLEAHAEQEKAIAETAIMEAKKKKRKCFMTKQLETYKARLEKEMDKIIKSDRKDNGIFEFEKLGVDCVIVDEAQAFKNLKYYTKMYGIAGLPNSESQRSKDMFMKCQWVLKNGGKVIFATGTPVTNSIAELFTLMRYMMMDRLKQIGISHFDSWAANFGDCITSPELSPTGKYRVKTRFAKFNNLPELIALYLSFADVKLAIDVEGLVRPDCELYAFSAPPSKEQMIYMDFLADRAEAVKNREVDPEDDNMLKITGDGRSAALDIRLVQSNGKNWLHSKINKLVSNAFKIWSETKPGKLTQAIFCDFSSPKKDGRFNIYQYVKDALIGLGVPEKEVVFIHDYPKPSDRKRLFQMLNDGVIRIVLGSTQKLGTGCNIQKRLIAAHHLDAPWRPSDVEQRDGRIVRQGNLNKKVCVLRYVTEGKKNAAGFDSFLWQTLEIKARFIAQILSGQSKQRSVEDISGMTLNCAQMKALASGDPAIIEKSEVDNEVQKLSLARRAWNDGQFALQLELKRSIARNKHLPSEIAALEADLATAKQHPITADKFLMTVAGREYDRRKDAGLALLAEVKRLSMGRVSGCWSVGQLCGIDIVVCRDPDGTMTAALQGEKRYSANLSSEELGTVMSLQRIATYTIAEKLEQVNKEFTANAERVERLSQQTESFEHEERLAQLIARQKELEIYLAIAEDNAAATANEESGKGAKSEEGDDDEPNFYDSDETATYTKPEHWILDEIAAWDDPEWLADIKAQLEATLELEAKATDLQGAEIVNLIESEHQFVPVSVGRGGRFKEVSTRQDEESEVTLQGCLFSL